MLVGCAKYWQAGYDFEELAKWCEDQLPFSCYHEMVEFLKTKDKMLDNFEEELEDVGYFDSLE
jgi:hypothetical protein